MTMTPGTTNSSKSWLSSRSTGEYLRRIDIEGVCRKVQELFKVNKQILVEFNRLIPSDFRIQVQPVRCMQAIVHYQDATQYMRRVQVSWIWTCTNYHRRRRGKTQSFTVRSCRYCRDTTPSQLLLKKYAQKSKHSSLTTPPYSKASEPSCPLAMTAI